jgi:hypothetical protein
MDILEVRCDRSETRNHHLDVRAEVARAIGGRL